MNADEEPKSLDVEVVDFDNEGPDGYIDPEALEKLISGFGKGATKRKIVVSKGITLTDLLRMDK